jgi:hypothetical protein
MRQLHLTIKGAILALCLAFVAPTTAQIIYFNDTNGNIRTFDIATCNSTLIVNGPVFNDMAVGPSGIFYGLFGQEIWEINTNTGNNTFLAVVPPNNTVVTGIEFGNDGFVYVLSDVVWAVNPANGTIVNRGALPANWFCVGDIVYYQGQYYAAMWINGTGTNDQLCIIDVNNPGDSAPFTPTPQGTAMVAGASVFDEDCPRMYWYDTGALNLPSTVWELNMTTLSWTQICGGFGFTVGGADTPNDYSFPISCVNCTTEAGTLGSNFANVCVPDDIIVPHNNDDDLDANDILRFILFSDFNNPWGSILANSSTTTISFNPATMQFNVPYYVAAVAGNNLNGNVDPADPCKSISNVLTYIWRERPSVSFSVVNSSVCRGDCVDLTLEFTGNSPFNLSGDVISGSTVIDTFTGTYGNTGTLSICTSSSVPLGTLQVKATSLTDALCTCD